MVVIKSNAIKISAESLQTDFIKSPWGSLLHHDREMCMDCEGVSGEGEKVIGVLEFESSAGTFAHAVVDCFDISIT